MSFSEQLNSIFYSEKSGMICKFDQYLWRLLSQGNFELTACKGAGVAHPEEFFTCFREKLFARAAGV